MSERQIDSMVRASRAVADLPITFLPREYSDIGALVAGMRKVARRRKPGLIIVDYLQLLRSAVRGNANEQVSDISRSLKSLAMQLDVPVLALSQLSRAVEQRGDKRPQLANHIVQVLSVLFEHAIDLGWRDDNPARGVRSIRGKSIERRPWPAEKIAAFREAAPVGTRARLIFEVLLGTGQRIGDALRMRWDDIEDGGIRVSQSKTDMCLWVPLTRELRIALEATPRTGFTIISDAHGRPVSYATASKEIIHIRKQIGAEAYDQHALRYTAAAELGALGCSDETIQAITGHRTQAMVRKYAGEARQRALARAAGAARERGAGRA